MDPSREVRLPNVADIEKQLARFWSEAGNEKQAVMRACMHNLVVVCAGDEDVTEAVGSIAAVSEQHPGRVLVVSSGDAAGGGASSGLDTFVSTHCHRAGEGRLVCCEQVTLKARGEAGARLIPETVLQLLEGDCPVHTWWRRPGLTDDALWEPLSKLSDRCIVNSARLRDPARVLAELAGLAAADSRGGDAGDLAWVRLEPWREVVAAQFDPATARGYLDGITAVEIDSGGTTGEHGVTAAAAYMVGWLASRLGWTLDEDRGDWTRPDGGAVEVRLVGPAETGSRLIAGLSIEATLDGRAANFVAERTAPGDDAVRLRVEAEGACALPYMLRVELADDVPLLCGELERSPRDDVFEASLEAAARWAAARRG